MINKLAGLLAVVALGCTMPAARADVINVELTGIITAFDTDIEPFSRFPDQFASVFVGQLLYVTYTFETGIPDAAGAFPNTGTYLGSITSMTVATGFRSNSYTIPIEGPGGGGSSVVINDPDKERLGYGFQNRTIPTPGQLNLWVDINFFNDLATNNPDLLSSDAAVAAPDVQSWVRSTFQFNAEVTATNRETIKGSFTHATVTSVPLPAAAWLLLSGIGAAGAFARRRRA